MEQLTIGDGPRYVQMQSEPEASTLSSLYSFHQDTATRIFDELPQATIIQVSRSDAGDISPMLLTYTIEVQYKQVLFFTLCNFLFYLQFG